MLACISLIIQILDQSFVHMKKGWGSQQFRSGHTYTPNHSHFMNRFIYYIKKITLSRLATFGSRFELPKIIHDIVYYINFIIMHSAFANHKDI